jgi:hypothetical protein
MSLITESILESLSICLNTLPTLCISLLIFDILNALGVLNKLSFLVSPISKIAGLSKESTLSLITAIGSVTSADFMTARLFKEGKIGKFETVISAQANTIPGYLHETFTYLIPVVIPLLGVGPGILYTSAFLLNALLKILLIFFAGTFLSNRSSLPVYTDNQILVKSTTFSSKALIDSFKKTSKMIFRITTLLFFASFIVICLDKYGALNFLSVFIKPVMEFLKLPEEFFAPVCGYMASAKIGASAVGTLYKSGKQSHYCTTVAALLGGILTLLIVTIRYTIARNISLFGPFLGSLNTALGFTTALLSRIIIITVLLMVSSQ